MTPPAGAARAEGELQPALALVLHLYGEPGLREAEREQRWERCYGPLFDLVDALPRLKIGLVLGGELLAEWDQEHPARLERIRAWITAGKVELLATPLWEPVLSAIPERDAIAQIVAHALLVKRLFGVRPRGCWLPFRQWDPGLPRVFERAEIEWVLVDDLAILHHHPGRPDPWGVWWTERGGHAVRMFATDVRAVEMAGDIPVRDLLLYARGRAVQGAALQFWALRLHGFGLARRRDAEADRAWLVEFLTGLDRAEHLALETPSAAAVRVPERGRTYLPSWGPPDRDHPWERHLLEHPEADRMHKKMLRVSRQLGRWTNEVAKGDSRSDPDGLVQAERYLLRAQGAEAYRPGDDPARRWRAWRDLVRAERQILSSRGLLDRAVAEVADLSTSGRPRVLLRTVGGCVVVDPAGGAALLELSLYDVSANVVDPWQPRDPVSGSSGSYVETVTVQDRGPVAPAWRPEGHERDDDGTARCSFEAEVPLGSDGEALIVHKTFVLRAAPRLDWTLDLHNPGMRPVRGRVALQLQLQLGPDLEGVELSTKSHSWPATEPFQPLGELAEIELGVLATLAGAPGSLGHRPRTPASVDGSRERAPVRTAATPTTALRLGLRRPARVATAPVRTLGPRGETYDQGLMLTLEWSFELVGGERDRLGTSLEVGT